MISEKSTAEAPKAGRLLQTTDLRRERVETEIAPPTRGPQTMDLRRDKPMDLELCLQHALPAEWRDFRERVMERVNSRPRFVLMRCSKCGMVTQRDYWKQKDGGACIKCNWAGYADGGFMKDMTPAQARKHEADKRAADEAWKAQNEKRGLYLRNQERGKSGLDPLTLEEYRAEKKTDYERKRALEARLDARRSTAPPLPQPPAPDLTLTQRGTAPAIARKGKVK